MGPQRRGIAVGLGECTIYVSTAIINIVAGDLASRFGYRPVPFWVATVFAVFGLFATLPLQDTLDQVQAEQNQQLTQLSSTIRLSDNNIDIDLEAVKEEIMSYAGSGHLRRSIRWNKSQRTINDNQTDLSSKQFEGYNHFLELENDTDFTSPADVKELHKKLMPENRSSTSTSDDDNDRHHYSHHEKKDSFYSEGGGSHDQIIILKPSCKVYESVNDSDIDSHDSDYDPDDKYKEWDEKVRKTVRKIPSTLQVIGKIPSRILGCGALTPCHPDTSRISRSRRAVDMETGKFVNESTPLFMQTYEDYEVSQSDIDSDDEANNEVDWDEVEDDVKALYPSAFHILAHILWNNPNYGILCIAGMTMNFKDGFAWGSFPLFFSKFHHLSDDHTDMLVAIYPLCWGFAQAFTGALSDIYGRSLFLLMGFGACAVGTALFFVPGFVWGRPADDNLNHIVVWVVADVFLGLGTALAYPALQAAVADEILPVYRGLGLGFYRFMRDMGYVVGALVCGKLTDILGYPATFLIVAGVLGTSFIGIFVFYKPLNLVQ